MMMNDGQLTQTLSGAERMISHVNRSNLATSVNIAESAQAQVSEQISHMESQARSDTEAMQSAQMTSYQRIIDKGYAQQEARDHGQSLSGSTQASHQSSASKMASAAQQLAKDHNLQDKTASYITAAFGLGMSSGQVIQKLGVDTSTQAESNVVSAIKHAEHMSQQDNWQETFQQARQEAESYTETHSSQEMKRHNRSIQAAWNASETHQRNLQYTHNHMESLQRTHGALKTHASTINHDGSQELMEWVAQKQGVGSMHRAQKLAMQDPERFQAYARDFAKEKAHSLMGNISAPTVASASYSPSKASLASDSSIQHTHAQHEARLRNTAVGCDLAPLPQSSDRDLFQHVEAQTAKAHTQVHATQETLQKNYDALKDRSTVTRAGGHVIDNTVSAAKGTYEFAKEKGESGYKMIKNAQKDLYDTLSNIGGEKKDNPLPKAEKHTQ